jgi:hypothetical protein
MRPAGGDSGRRTGDRRREGLIPRARRRIAAIRHGRSAVLPADPHLSRLLERLNPSTLARATGHKVILHRHLAALGLPVPRLHGVIGRAGGWSASTARPVLDAAAATRFLAGLTGDIVVRPFAASRGAGVRVLRREGPVFSGLDGRHHEPSAVVAEAYADPRSELFVVQERVTPHARMRGLVRDGRLPTARLTTFVADDGRAEVVHACLMPPVLAEIDVATGAPTPHGSAPLAGWEECERLPDWDAACELALRGAGMLMPQRTIAWEIALTPDGPVVLGADSRYERIAGVRFDEALEAIERAVAEGGPVRYGGAA